MSAKSTVHSGRTTFIFKLFLAFIYVIALAIAQSTEFGISEKTIVGYAICGVVLLPLLPVALVYYLWWQKADEFQKNIEIMCCATAGASAVMFLVFAKLLSYFVDSGMPIPSLSVLGMMLIYWISASRTRNVQALKA